LNHGSVQDKQQHNALNLDNLVPLSTQYKLNITHYISIKLL